MPGVSDFWLREIGAMGEMGPDHGQGGTYVVLAPGVDAPDDLPDDFRTLVSTGVNIMFGFRTLDPDPARAEALVAAVRIYPYEPFAPDARLTGILERGAAAGELMAQANTFAKRFEQGSYWPDRAWEQAIVLDNSAQRGDGYDELLERASWFYEAVSFSEAMKSQTPGVGQAYLGSYTDAAGEWLDGGADYTLHVPADVPAKLFWSATVYDAATRCLIDNPQQRGDRGSRDTDLVTNDDGSVDLLFGPTAPASGESNWVQTIPGKHWFSYFRLYGPLESYFDRSWKLGDISRVASD
ncbi:DUF1214 domain-containing protein [Subtercola sp. YIM 133946]|uniref:DUF1214 domain-containing protein n=1 Tax=Subtercola sp. YIM 133946 TaxID=3118909 RepID=UPI002F94A553